MDQIFGSEQLTGALRTVSLTAAISWKPREKVTISDRPGNDLPRNHCPVRIQSRNDTKNVRGTRFTENFTLLYPYPLI